MEPNALPPQLSIETRSQDFLSLSRKITLGLSCHVARSWLCCGSDKAGPSSYLGCLVAEDAATPGNYCRLILYLRKSTSHKPSTSLASSVASLTNSSTDLMADSPSWGLQIWPFIWPRGLQIRVKCSGSLGLWKDPQDESEPVEPVVNLLVQTGLAEWSCAACPRTDFQQYLCPSFEFLVVWLTCFMQLY